MADEPTLADQIADAQRLVEFHKSQAAIHRDSMDSLTAMAKEAGERLAASNKCAEDAQSRLDKLKTEAAAPASAA